MIVGRGTWYADPLDSVDTSTNIIGNQIMIDSLSAPCGDYDTQQAPPPAPLAVMVKTKEESLSHRPERLGGGLL